VQQVGFIYKPFGTIRERSKVRGNVRLTSSDILTTAEGFSGGWGVSA